MMEIDIKAKVLSANSPKDLEISLNQFLKEESVGEVISTTFQDAGSETDDHLVVVIFYKLKSPLKEILER